MAGLMGVKDALPPPEPPEPTPMVDEAAIRRSKKRSILSSARRKGRESTILSGADDRPVLNKIASKKLGE